MLCGGHTQESEKQVSQASRGWRQQQQQCVCMKYEERTCHRPCTYRQGYGSGHRKAWEEGAGKPRSFARISQKDGRKKNCGRGKGLEPVCVVHMELHVTNLSIWLLLFNTIGEIYPHCDVQTVTCGCHTVTADRLSTVSLRHGADSVLMTMQVVSTCS